MTTLALFALIGFVLGVALVVTGLKHRPAVKLERRPMIGRITPRKALYPFRPGDPQDPDR